MKKLLYTLFILLAVTQACTIEPPLKLASAEDGYMTLGKVVTDLDVVWDLDTAWENNWWYGWDDQDVKLWGELAYPEPSSYEVRVYYYGEAPDPTWSSVAKRTVYDTVFHHNFQPGFHDMLVWSNINSADGIQVVVINEDDADNIQATTSRARLGYSPHRAAATEARNNPEIFYANEIDRLFLSRNPADYDYYDSERNAWVKRFDEPMYPMVYVYLVQVVIYNNRGRITGLADLSAITDVADGVNIHTGRTSNRPVAVTYRMRLKRELPARGRRMADIFGGKLTTFGLCDMNSWAKSRGPEYSGSRTDLSNFLAVDLAFANATDSVFRFNVTNQMQRQSHGGIITIEIDADTIKFPSGGVNGSGFRPTINPSDSITHEFEL